MDTDLSKLELPDNTFWDWVENDLEHVKYSDTDSVYLLVNKSIISYELDNVDRLIQIGKYVGEVLDSWIADYYTKILLPKSGIDPKHNHIQFKNELCATRIMFLDVKKNYAFLPVAIKNKALKSKQVSSVGLSVLKSNTAPMTVRLMQELLDVFVFNIDDSFDINTISKTELSTKFSELGKTYGVEIKESIKTFNLTQLGTKVKWNSGVSETFYTVQSMKLFNLLVGEEVFKPMVAGTLVSVEIPNSHMLEQYKIAKYKGEYWMDVDVTKVNYITIPINYSKYTNTLEQKFQELGISINPQSVWKTIVNTGCERIIEVVKNHVN